MSKIEPLKVVIDLLGLDIENLVHAEKIEAIEALEHSLLTLIENKSKISKHEEKNRGKFTCERCGKHFSQKDGMNNHKKRGISACQKYLKRQHENVEGKLVCTECDYKTSSKANLRNHFRKHTNQYHCRKCNLNFGRKSYLSNHLEKNHPDKSEEELKDGRQKIQ